MKKIYIAAVAAIIAFTGCGGKKEEENTINSEIEAEWVENPAGQEVVCVLRDMVGPDKLFSQMLEEGMNQDEARDKLALMARDC